MVKIYLVILIASILTGCSNNGRKQEDFDRLKSELEECKKTVGELSNTPQMRLAKGQRYQDEKKLNEAKFEYQTLIERYPGTNEAKTALELIANIEEQVRKKREEEERKKTLSFKALAENTTVKVGDVSLKFNSVTATNQWIYDDYGPEYRLGRAERENIYIIAKIAITAETKDPNLPPISVYEASGGSLILLGTLSYRFVRWKDYGSYLGNYGDYGNDFAYTKTISFSCGLQISQSDIDNNVVFVVVKNSNCFYRKYDRFSGPSVAYVENDCGVKSILTVEDFDNGYTLIKIFNKNKL